MTNGLQGGIGQLVAGLCTRRWLKLLHSTLGTTQHVIEVDPEIARMEGMRVADVPEYDDPKPDLVKITEHGIRYAVDNGANLLIPVPGGVLVRAADGTLLGAVGVSGDTSDNDEIAAVAGIEAAGLVAQPD